MSVKTSSLVWESRLPSTKRYIVAAMADQANDEGYCIYRRGEEITQEMIAEKTGLDVRTIRRNIAEMLNPDYEFGVLEIVKAAKYHSPPEYRIRVDILSALKRVKGGHCVRSKGGHGVLPETEQGGHCVRSESAEGGHPVQQGGHCVRSTIRCLDVDSHRTNTNHEPEREEAVEELPEDMQTYALGDHAFQKFKAEYPKIAGKFLNEDLARIEFLKVPACWNMIIRAAKNYAESSIVKGCLVQGGKGIKYPNNFIRDGSWKDWLTPEIVEDEEAIMARQAKDEVTREAKKRDGMVQNLSPQGRKYFYSLNTHWHFIQKMAQEGRDIAGPQTDGPDVKTLAAEGGDAACM